MKRNYLFIGAAAFVLGAGSMAYVGAAANAKTEVSSREQLRRFELFSDVFERVRADYVDSDKVDEDKLIDAAINGMMAYLDPHSAYLDPSDFDDMRDTTRGAYGGLGLEVTQEQGVVKVQTPMEDTPASRAGLQTGDLIVAIDGKGIIGMDLNDAVDLMKGDPGAKIILTIAREDTDPFEVTLTREIIRPKAATARMEGDVGYLKLGSGFNEKTTDEARAAVQSLLSQNPNMKGLVLDLRNNPGGLLDQAVSVSDLFLDGGEVVSQRGRSAANIERYNARAGDMLAGRPMVVLVNSGSASAAEIVAGALKDRQRAEVVGLTSYGKGSVQTLYPLRGGADGALKLTTGRYFTPSGRSIQKTGIEPDLEVASTREQAEALAKQVFSLQTEANQFNALDSGEAGVRRGAHDIAEAPPEDFEAPCKDLPASEAAKLGAKCDFQLTRAIDVIHYGSVAATPKVPGLPQVAAVAPNPLPGMDRLRSLRPELAAPRPPATTAAAPAAPAAAH